MSSRVDIANMALSYLGEDTIISFTDDTNEAKAINLHYEACKRSLLMYHNWAFATKRQTLTEVTPLVLPLRLDPYWPYVFIYPADCLKMLRVDNDAKAWQRFKDQIMTESSTFNCEYIEDVSEQYFTPAFEEAFIYYLAGKICLAITGDKSLKGDTQGLYAQALQFAISANDLEQGIQTMGNLDGSSLRRGFYGIGIGENTNS
jgi:hypothetical protein